MDHTECQVRGESRMPWGEIAADNIDPPPKPGGLDRRRLTRALEYVEKHMAEDLTIDNLAVAACLSKYHFSRAFRVSMGTSPKRYLKERRLEMAKAMLARAGGTLTQIALVCGYSSEANFSRAFRSAVGFTPGRYRRTFGSAATDMRRYLVDALE
jgi:AraC family transcriptional regulator